MHRAAVADCLTAAGPDHGPSGTDRWTAHHGPAWTGSGPAQSKPGPMTPLTVSAEGSCTQRQVISDPGRSGSE